MALPSRPMLAVASFNFITLIKIKNGEVVSNDFGNNQDDEGKRKSGSAERQLTAKEKLRIMLSEADRKDQITLRIAQEIE